MTDPSEAEMRVATLAYSTEIANIPARSHLTTSGYQAAQRVAHERGLRAALTAAAQVRERAEHERQEREYAGLELDQGEDLLGMRKGEG